MNMHGLAGQLGLASFQLACFSWLRVHIPVQTAVAPVQTSVPPTFPALAQKTVPDNATKTPPLLTSQDLQTTTFVQSAWEADELNGKDAFKTDCLGWNGLDAWQGLPCLSLAQNGTDWMLGMAQLGIDWMLGMDWMLGLIGCLA
jgi:hypothetical protein